MIGQARAWKAPRRRLPSGKRKQSTPKDADEDNTDETPTKKAKRTLKKAAKKESAPEVESGGCHEPMRRDLLLEDSQYAIFRNLKDRGPEAAWPLAYRKHP